MPKNIVSKPLKYSSFLLGLLLLLMWGESAFSQSSGIQKAQVTELERNQIMETSITVIVDSLEAHHGFSERIDTIRTRLNARQFQDVEFLFEELKQTLGLYGVKNTAVINEKYVLIDIVADLGWSKLREGRFLQAKDYFLLMTNWIERLGLEESDAYIWASEKLGNVLLDLGDFDGSERWLLKTVQAIDRREKCNPIQKTVLFQSLARVYLSLELYDKAHHYLNRAIDIQIAENLDRDLLFGYSLQLSGDIRVGQLDWDDAVRLYTLAKDIYMSPEYEEEAEQRLSLLLGLMTVYQVLGDYAKAEDVSSKILEICSCVDDVVLSCAFHYQQLATLYWSQGYMDQAGKYLELSLDILRQLTGEQSTYVMETKGLMFRLFYETGELEIARNLFDEYYDYVLSDLSGSTFFLSEKEVLSRLPARNKNLNYLSNAIREYYKSRPEYSSYQYNLALSTKALALNSSVRMRETLEMRGDTVVLANYDYWLNLMSTIAKNNFQENHRYSYLDSLEHKAEDLEKQLSRASEDFVRSIEQVTWEMIGNKLSGNEAAIEFSSFQCVDSEGNWTDSTLYTAVILRSGDTCPRMVTLFEQRDFDALVTTSTDDQQRISMLYRGAVPVSDEIISHGEELYELVWLPLEEYLEGVSKVYFSPSGSLHELSFSAIPITGDSLLMDRYDLNRVGSTSVITYEDEERPPKDIVLFGGMDYSMDTVKLQALAQDVSTKNLYSGGVPKDISRGNTEWANLPATREEVERIGQIAKQQGINATTYLGEDALEERYKKLGGKHSPSVLHIATHGFFFPDPEKEKNNDQFRRMQGDRPSIYRASDDPMNRSGILFSGANTYWTGIDPSTSENGILTAKEATYVPLINTKLVVLSACETGLGEIKGSEGVFGLQRAFKASGAEYLLMSLWKVPDQETSEFMKLFYGHYLSNNAIPDSYHHAQRVMRVKYPNDPYKWAGFVLMR